MAERGETAPIMGEKHVLCVDIGNTTTRFGLFAVGDTRSGRGTSDGDGSAGALRVPANAGAGGPAKAAVPAPELLGSCEVTTRTPVTADEALIQIRHALELLPEARLDGAILSCVIPAITAAWRSACGRACAARALIVGPGLKSGVPMRYDDPSEVGPDRVADVVALRATYGAPAVAVDLGTTTNFEVLDARGAFAGGVIAPGVALGARALAEAAARLPMIELRAPAQVIGRNTRAAMQSGLVLGEVARIDGLLDGILAELAAEGLAASDADGGNAAEQPFPIVLTGDGAKTIARLLRHSAVVDDTLTLRGLALLWMRNQR